MNWVGGARNRLKKKSDIKKQQEFFHKRRQEIANNSKKRDSHNTPRLSRDLLTFNLLKIKSRKIYKEAKPTKVIKQDLEKFNTTKTSHVNLPETPIAFDNYSSKIKEKTKYNAEIYSAEEENVDDISLNKGSFVRRNNCYNLTENTQSLQMPSESDVECRKQDNSFTPFYAENNSLIELADCDKKETVFKPKYQNKKEYKSFNADSQDVPFVQPLSELFNTKEGVASVQPLKELLNIKQDVDFVQPLNELLNTTYPHNVDSLKESDSERDCIRKEIFSIFDSSAKHKQSSTKLDTNNRRNYAENVNYKLAWDNFCVHSQKHDTSLDKGTENCYDANIKHSYKNYDNEEFEDYSNAENFCASKLDDAANFIDKDALQLSRNYFENNYPKPGASKTFRVGDFMENCDFVRKTNERNNSLKGKDIMYRNLNPEMASFLNTSSFETYGRKNDAFNFSKANIDTECENKDLEDYSIFQEQIFLIKQSKTRIHPDMISRHFHTSDFDINKTKNTGIKRKRNHNSVFDTHHQNLYFDYLNDDREEEQSFNILRLKNKSHASLKTQSLSHCMDVEKSNISLFTGEMESPESSREEASYEKTRLPCYNSASTIPYVYSDSNQTFKNVIRHTEYQNYRDDAISKNDSNFNLPIFSNNTANMSSFCNKPRHKRKDKASKTEKNESKLAHMNSNFAMNLYPTCSFKARNEMINNFESQELQKNNKVFQEQYRNENMDLPTAKCSKQHDVISKMALSNNEMLIDKDFDDSNTHRYNTVFHSTPLANIYETLKITDNFSQHEDYSNKCLTLPENGINLKPKKVKYLRKNETMTKSADYMKVLQVKCKMDKSPVYDYSKDLNFESNVINSSMENTPVKTKFKQDCLKQLKINDDVQEFSILIEREQSKDKSDFTETLNENTSEVLKENNVHLQNEDYTKECLQLPDTENDLISKEIKNEREKEVRTSEMASIDIGNMKIPSAKYKRKEFSILIEREQSKDTNVQEFSILIEREQSNDKSDFTETLNENTSEVLKENNVHLQNEDYTKECLQLPDTENDLISKEIKNEREKEIRTSEMASIDIGNMKIPSAKYKSGSTFPYDDSENLSLQNNVINSSNKISPEKPKLTKKCIEHSQNQDDNKKRSMPGEIEQLKNKTGFIKDFNEATSEALKIKYKRLDSEDYSMKTSVLPEIENNSISKEIKNAPEKQSMALCAEYMKVSSVKQSKNNTSVCSDSEILDQSLDRENNFIDSSIKIHIENLKFKGDYFKQLENNGDGNECSILAESEHVKNKSDLTQALNENSSKVLKSNDELLQTEDFSKKTPVLSETEINLRPKENKNVPEKEITKSWNDCIKVLSVKYKKDNIIMYDDSKCMGKSLNFEKHISSTKCVYEKSTLIEEYLQHPQNNDEFKKCSILEEASNLNDKDDLNESALDAILNCEVIINTDEKSGKGTNTSVLEVEVYSPKQDDHENYVKQVIKCNEQSIINSGNSNVSEENKFSQLDVTSFQNGGSSIDQLSPNSSDSQCSKIMVSAKDLDYEITKVCTLPDETDLLTGIHISYKNLLNSHNDHFSHKSTKCEKSSFNSLEVGTQTVIETIDFGCQVSL